ncbi:BQ5605_C015g07867 [Microbotryum silenes-dioicae]|uniref:BQ5605_C015g07867 protein n=1 Tax=Microbotryum silenes-dioicae TaxID=796604 RepID=A0A2X0LXQ3_9BASI|nr:BQ5605_C015g07867 [Microbotryum silenes-dioicae]
MSPASATSFGTTPPRSTPARNDFHQVGSVAVSGLINSHEPRRAPNVVFSPYKLARRRKFNSPLLIGVALLSFIFWSSLKSTNPKGTLSLWNSSTCDEPSWKLLPRWILPGRTPNSNSRCLSRALQRRTDRPISDDFKLSDNALPIHFVHEKIHFHNTPISAHRPASNQFMLAPDVAKSGQLRRNAPVLSIITATQNPRSLMLETAQTVLGQSLQNIQWVIVDDHSNETDSLAMLASIAKDPRVVILKNTGDRGLAASRNVALNWLLSESRIAAGLQPRYIASLDDDDLYELTALEKTVWMLESNPEWDLGGFHVIKFNANNETIVQGVHSGSANFFNGNFVPNAAVYTSRAIVNTGCRYDDVNFAVGGEDWDFWMCLAENGHWGGSVPEPLYWYRGNPATFRQSRWGNMFVDGFSDLKRRIEKKHPALLTSGTFPDIAARPSRQLEPIRWDAPFESHLARFTKAVMFVVPWLYIGGADIGALHQIQLFAERGYRVTVVCTLYKNPEGLELRPAVLQFTHDVHVVPSFLRANDIPRYIKYLVQSRGIDEIIMSNSQLFYEMLPALAEQMPHVKMIDYLHNEAYDGWKSGGYPTLSVITQRFLSRTVTCSSYLRDWLIARGHDAGSIGVVKLGIQVGDFVPATPSERAAAKRDALEIDPRTTVITIVGRLDPQKRPTLVPLIADTLRRIGQYKPGDFIILMVGDGALKGEVAARIGQNKVKDYVRVLGTVGKPQQILAATDIFLLPTMGEGISIAVAEAMAMALPVVSGRVGALPEQLGAVDQNSPEAAGVLIEQTMDDKMDAPLYAYELHRLIGEPNLRREYGAQGRRLVETTFDWRQTLMGLFDEIKLARLPSSKRDLHTPNPAAYFALQTLLLENGRETDFAVAQNALRMPRRTGFGRELQDRCGESTKALTEWINSLVKPTACNKRDVLDVESLQASAKYQCSAWWVYFSAARALFHSYFYLAKNVHFVCRCIFDLTTTEHAGWSFNGACFDRYDEVNQGWCRQFWSNRPADIKLPKVSASRNPT